MRLWAALLIGLASRTAPVQSWTIVGQGACGGGLVEGVPLTLVPVLTGDHAFHDALRLPDTLQRTEALAHEPALELGTLLLG